jgi:phage-related protein
MANTIGEVDVIVLGDYTRFVAESRLQGARAGRAAEQAFEAAYDPDGERASQGFWRSFNNDSDKRTKTSSKRLWRAFDNENDKNSDASAARAAKTFSGSFADVLGTQFKALAGRWAVIFGLVASVAEPAVVGLAGLASAAVALASSGLIAVVGGVAPLPAILASLGLFAGAAAFGLSGMGTALKGIAETLRSGDPLDEQLEAINEAVKNLSPNGAEFAKTFAGINVLLDETRRKVQDRIFAGLDDELIQLAVNLIPNVESSFLAVGDVINRTAKEISAVLLSADVAGILRGMVGVIDTLASSVAPLTGAFLDFVAATLPGAQRLADKFLAWSENIADFFDRVNRDGSFAAWVDRALDSLDLWLDLFGSVKDNLILVARLGQDFGDRMVASLTRTITGWTKNEEGIQRFYEMGERVMAALSPIMDALGEAIAKLVTEDSIGRFEELAVAVAELIVPLGDILVAFSETGILTAFAEALTAVLELIVLISPVLIRIGNLIAALLTIIGDFVEAATAFLESFFKTVNQLFADISNNWRRPLEAFASWFTSAWDRLTSTISALWSGLMSGITTGIRAMSDFVTGVWDTLSSTVGGVVAAFVGRVIGLWTTLTGGVETAVSAIETTWGGLVSFFTGLPGKFGEALSGLVDAITAPFKKAYDKAKEWVDKIKGLPGSIAGGIGNAIGGIFGRRAFAEGGLVFGPTRALIGEAGPEAVIPLNRPLSQIDPAVRAMAAQLRGMEPSSSTTTTSSSVNKTIAPVFNITETGNAEVTARKVMNRLLPNL